MKHEIYSAFDINLTKKEYKIIQEFCQTLDDYMDYLEDNCNEVMYEIICNIARGKDLGHNKINIVEEHNE